MNETPRHPTTDAVTALGLKLSYGTAPVLRGVDISLAKGRTLALLGPSGCGKTTLLRLVAGLLAPTAGTIAIDGEIVADAATGAVVPPERRGLGMVFQDYALWPHFSIAQNVSFPLEMRGVGRAERERRVAAALDRVGLGGFGARSPGDLSGGQQQRVAIARAIVGEPGLVLFDEPLSNLDRELRESMVSEIAQLVAGLGLTSIYVTHDQSEAFTLADQVAVMRLGEIAQLAAPEELVARPASAEVAEFLRLGTIAPVTLRDATWWLDAAGVALAPAATVDAPADAATVLLGRNAVALADPANAALRGVVVASRFRGEGHTATVRIGANGRGIELQLESGTRIEAGENVGLRIEPRQLRWFAANSSSITKGAF